MIEILTPAQLEQARPAGRFVGTTLQALRERVGAGTNLLEIDDWTRQLIADAGAVSCYVDYAPAFGRGPFGKVICTSVNDAVLHGLPHDYALVEGDLLTLDFAISLDGWVADAAISFIVGDAGDWADQQMIDATEVALAAGIAAARPWRVRRRHLRSDRRRAHRRRGSRSTATSAGTGWGERCTRTPTSPTQERRGGATACVRACCWRSSRG